MKKLLISIFLLFGLANVANASLIHFDLDGHVSSSSVTPALSVLAVNEVIDFSFDLDTLSSLTSSTASTNTYGNALSNVNFSVGGVATSILSSRIIISSINTSNLNFGVFIDSSAAPFSGSGFSLFISTVYSSPNLLGVAGDLSSLNELTLSTLEPFEYTFASFSNGSGRIALGDPPAQVPEPTTLVLFILGLAGVGFSRRKHSLILR